MSDTAQQDRAKAYKKSLNLPKTSFPMKANLVQNEPASQKRWKQADLYDRAQAARPHDRRFVFHDGPPYANGNIHLGHMLNKCLKDFVVRTKLMEGMRCPFVPGWDCHGLPIEHRVMQELAGAGKLEKIAALDDDARRMAVRRECEKYASKHVKQHITQMERLLTLADYEHPYLTMHHDYEGAVLEVFAGLVEKGLVYRQLKAVHWSVDNETALADAELEYYDREDISVYVDFVAADAEAVYRAFGLDPDDDQTPTQSPCFMIWTTTPWTLPANLAIAVHEKFTYALVKVDGNITVLAEALVEQVTKAGKAESVEVLATTTGDTLVGLRYRHPFMESGPNFSTQPDAAMRGADPSGIYRVVSADYVTLEDGTGLVHTAPGHGAEDYMTGLKEKLPVYCPVTEDGTYDASVPDFLRGVKVWDANEQITELLRTDGALFYDHRFMHSYPHDWRGKTPVIFRATEQWFIEVDNNDTSLRAMAFQATDPARDDSVRFVPEWGRNRMRGMLETRPDWCISRQRAWGLPIPAFYTPSGETLLNESTVRAVAKRFREKGSDAWFTEDPASLLQHWENPDNLDLSTLRKGMDIFDVWFESGSSWNAVMRERSDGADYPIELYLEGSDQHRGWFQLSMLPALGVTGRPPFETLLTHGFCVDKDGKKMSKSLGNTLEVDMLIERFGADVCRWWVASVSYENDIKTDLSFFETAGESYRKIRNTLRFMLSNLSDFHASSPGCDDGMCVAPSDMPPASLEAWVLSAFDAVSQKVRAAYASYQFNKVTSLLYNFCNDTLSATYLAAVKDRLYCDAPDSARRRRTQTALWDLTDGLARLLAPIMPHTADEAHRALRNVDQKDTDECVHLKTFIDSMGVTAHDAWPTVMRQRDAWLRALEDVRAKGEIDNPLDAGIVAPDPDNVLAAFDPADLADLCQVSRFRVGDALAVENLSDEPRCERSWKRDGTVKERSDGGMLSDRDAEAVGIA
ncbi:MAG: isoleucine--tRNA ligase [Phycisphaerales bacterium]